MRLTLACVSLLCALLQSAPIHAQRARCVNPKELASFLKVQFKEDIVAIAVDSMSRLVRIFASPAGTWTITVSPNGGEACIVATGYGWSYVTAKPGNPT